MAIKAYVVRADDCGCVLVFAESPSKAKVKAWKEDALEMCEYLELEVRREPKADGYRHLAY